MASPYDLTDLADLKSWLDVQSDDDDDLLGTLITQVSRAILTYCDRPSILPALYNETRDGGNEEALVLRQWPVTAILVADDRRHVDRPGLALAAGRRAHARLCARRHRHAPPGHMQKLALRGKRFHPGVQNISIAYQAGYQIIE